MKLVSAIFKLNSQDKNASILIIRPNFIYLLFLKKFDDYSLDPPLNFFWHTANWTVPKIQLRNSGNLISNKHCLFSSKDHNNQ